MNNKSISQMLRNMAASYEILGENRFRINAYNQAADAIDNLPVSVQELWTAHKLTEIPGVGGSIASHIEELFKTGKSKHFEETFRKIPQGTFELMKVRTIGPKTAVKLAVELSKSKYSGKTIYERLDSALLLHTISEIEGFGEKREKDIEEALKQFVQGQRKKKRMLFAEADAIAQKICSYLRKDNNVDKIDILGSLRRKKDTVGDIDMAVTSSHPTETINYFTSYPQLKTLVDKGPKGATIITQEGVQVDLRVADPTAYGAMLQYFTGNKYHNIKIREYALSKGLSISEHGIKKLSTKKLIPAHFETEKEFYGYLGLPHIPPEMREDKGEIELALVNKLPHLVETSDIKGDLHIHSNYDLSSSHDTGLSSLEELLGKAQNLGYEYIGLSDHNPKQSLSESEIINILSERKQYIDNIIYSKKVVQNYKSIKKVFIMLEVDIKPDGTLALPLGGFDYVDAILVSIHSSFNQSKDVMTKRILKALTTHSKVRVFAHPTGRLIESRLGVEAHWESIFDKCRELGIALEINASPNRLDLPDQLVWQARSKGNQFIIGTDTHQVNSMDDMKYGVAVARRGWAEKHDILNALSSEKFVNWLGGEF